MICKAYVVNNKVPRRHKMGVSSLHDATIKYSSIAITVTWKVLVKQFLLLLPRPVT